MSHFNGNLEGNLEELRQLLKAQTFEPVPVKRVYIPKSDGKKGSVLKVEMTILDNQTKGISIDE